MPRRALFEFSCEAFFEVPEDQFGHAAKSIFCGCLSTLRRFKPSQSFLATFPSRWRSKLLKVGAANLRTDSACRSASVLRITSRIVKRSLFLLTSVLLAAWSVAAQLTLADVQQVIAQAATRASQISTNSVIAVSDREGYILGVWSVNGMTPATGAFTDLVANATAKAGTAAFLSTDQQAFTSRTAGFIVQQHFPPGINNKPPGPLVGVNFSNLPFSDVNRLKDPASYDSTLTNGVNGGPVPTPITGGLAGTPGGVPLYKNGHL